MENTEWYFGEINEDTKELNIEFIQVDNKEFEEKEIDISECLSKEELIEKINSEQYEEDKYFKIVLTGNRKIEINTNDILKNIEIMNVIKIKDKTKLELDLEKIAMQNNLKGIFVKSLLEKQKGDPENREVIQKAIEIGLSAFN